MARLDLDLDGNNLECRVAEFKQDPEKMKQVNEFLDDLIEKAKIEVELRQAAQQKAKTGSTFGLQNGSKKIAASINKARTSARTFTSRVFTAICNCTNSVKSAVVNRN